MTGSDDESTGIGPGRAWAEIDLTALRHTIGVLRRAAPDSLLMAVVKADAYGHGLAECAAAARSGGADWLGVALVGEALALRDAGGNPTAVLILAKDENATPVTPRRCCPRAPSCASPRGTTTPPPTRTTPTRTSGSAGATVRSTRWRTRG